jgi:hypothetical protein
VIASSCNSVLVSERWLHPGPALVWRPRRAVGRRRLVLGHQGALRGAHGSAPLGVAARHLSLMVSLEGFGPGALGSLAGALVGAGAALMLEER